MSLFIASLAFGPGALLDSAKVGVLGASLASGLVGGTVLAVGRAKKLSGGLGAVRSST
jgi:Na+/H+ antiporter NhaA